MASSGMLLKIPVHIEAAVKSSTVNKAAVVAYLQRYLRANCPVFADGLLNLSSTISEAAAIEDMRACLLWVRIADLEGQSVSFWSVVCCRRFICLCGGGNFVLMNRVVMLFCAGKQSFQSTCLKYLISLRSVIIWAVCILMLILLVDSKYLFVLYILVGWLVGVW